MSEEMLSIPRSSVAAAGRALKFMIDELKAKLREEKSETPYKSLIETEIMEMMDANKAMFSALPGITRVEASADLKELQARLIERTEQSMATSLRDAETIRRLKAADARGWHPMETAPRKEKVIFWIIPKPPEECNVDSNGQPITSWNSPRFMFCEYGCWPSVDKAVAWMEPPSGPSPIPV
ncbi:MAG: hypothetical protein EBS21_02280 [Sphingomonadaceae bacterium]|nr:hypothetical protein [Sphingomonadaceae bacterium]